jgi:hypothetical protein
VRGDEGTVKVLIRRQSKQYSDRQVHQQMGRAGYDEREEKRDSMAVSAFNQLVLLLAYVPALELPKKTRVSKGAVEMNPRNLRV